MSDDPKKRKIMAMKNGSFDDLAAFLRGDTSMLKCTICGSQAGTCDCWTKCPCGWSFEKGARCRNPAHNTETEQ